MESHSRRILATFSALTAALTLVFIASAQQPRPPASTSHGRLAEEVYKNIKSFKGRPASELIPTMQFMSNSLGVDCSFCHDMKAFEKDIKDEKRTAREMIAMQQSINRSHFKGEREVTCNTCHHGEMHPAAAPSLPELNAPIPIPIESHEHASHDRPSVASPTEYLDSYLHAAGGEAALSRITSLTIHGTVNFGAGPQSRYESYTRSTGQRATVLTIPQGQAISAFNGHSGFFIYPGRHNRPMAPGEVEAMRVEADFLFPLNFKQRYSQLRVGHPEKINGAQAQVLTAVRTGQPPVRLYFDPQTHLLLRVLYYAETALGRNPTRIDIVHYMQSNGVQLPSEWIVTFPSSRSTYKVESYDTSPIPDSRFEPPATTRASSE